MCAGHFVYFSNRYKQVNVQSLLACKTWNEFRVSVPSPLPFVHCALLSCGALTGDEEGGVQSLEFSSASESQESLTEAPAMETDMFFSSFMFQVLRSFLPLTLLVVSFPILSLSLFVCVCARVLFGVIACFCAVLVVFDCFVLLYF